MTRHRNSSWRTLAIVASMTVLTAPAAHAFVFLNEISVKAPAFVELYNSDQFSSVDVNGWTIRGAMDHVIVGQPPIPPGGYGFIIVGEEALWQKGGLIELLDGKMIERDGVNYGQHGSAPLPPGSNGFRGSAATLARAPDASTYSIPPPHSPATDGNIWTIDLTRTPGVINDAPTPALGTELLLNELDPKPIGGDDLVEIYNPVAASVSLLGWWITNGDAVEFLAGSVPGVGFYVHTTGTGFDLEENSLVYLFRPDGVRVDQLGYEFPPVQPAGPALEYCECYARVEDGDGPNLGYEWFSSGGFDTFFPVLCTPGASNVRIDTCATTSAGEEPEPESWGRVKVRWRE